jgi:ChrR Cupin-like domain
MKKIASSVIALFMVSALAALAVEEAKTAATGQTAGKRKAGAKAAKAPGHVALAPADLKWGDAPPVLPPGAKLAVLEGNPMGSGPFTIRLRFPDAYKVAPHWHPTTEHVTVVSGTLHIAMGDTFDDTKGTALPAGGFAYMGRKMNHYAWASGETEIQVHGMGPFVLNYVNPADDPQKAKK